MPFIAVGPPVDPPRPGRNLALYRTLEVELRGAEGREFVSVGMKDNTDPDNGRETKPVLRDLTTEWQTFHWPTESFRTADRTRLYVLTEFVFESNTPRQTVDVRTVRFLP